MNEDEQYQPTQDELLEDQRQLDEQVYLKEYDDIPVFQIPEVVELPDEYISQKIDQEGGVGAQYSVTTKSYEAFKSAVNGKGFDIDNFYGWQCWDGTALLWQQFGKSLITGNGLAIGCWDLKREQNKYDLFTLVSKYVDLKRGDVVVMRPNHIGFLDGKSGDYMLILGQNQGGKPNSNGGSAFNIVKVHKSAFAGAFRLKKWHVAPKPSAPKKTAQQVAQEIADGKGGWGNMPERKKKVEKAGYNYNDVQARVNKIIADRNKKPAPKPSTKKYVTVQKGWGLSNIAKAGGFKDFASTKRWAEIARLNGSYNWQVFNNGLKAGQKVRVK